MKSRQKRKRDLEEVLRDLDYRDLQVRVDMERGRKLFAVVTTPDFDGMNEAERQSEVWGVIYDRLEEEDHQLIEFVFTNTPQEEEEMEREDERVSFS